MALFSPLKIGSFQISHRVVLAPLTRNRADREHIHHGVAATYYEQRAQEPGSLLITEGTFIDSSAGGFDHVPGVWNDEQLEAWKTVVDAVHAKGSYIFMQLWHIGRAGGASILARDGHKVVSSSDVPLKGGDIPTPLTIEDISAVKALYARAADNFVNKCGGDGVEIHGANGYLVDQFFSPNSNKRTDKYGGSAENRVRFGLEVVDAVVASVGAERTAIRISPYSPFQEMEMPRKDIKETFSLFVTHLRARQPNLAYLHVVESRISGATDVDGEDQSETLDFLHLLWTPRPMLVAGGFKRDTALAAAERRENTAIVFGRYYTSNPDLVKRLKKDLPLTPYDRSTFYLEGPDKTQGYTDFPNYENESEHRNGHAIGAKA